MKLHVQGEFEVRVVEVLGLAIGEWTNVVVAIEPTWGDDDARRGLTLRLKGTPPGTGICNVDMGSVHIDYEGHVAIRRWVSRPNHDHDGLDRWQDVRGENGELASVLPLKASY